MKVDIKPQMFRWAYERAGLDLADLEVTFPKLAAWEKGDAKPTLKQLEKFARATHAPVGYLFLSEPPDEKVPIPDFRTVGGKAIRRASPDLLETVYARQQRQEWYGDLARSSGEPPLPFVGSATVADGVVATAAKMREVLGFSLELQKRLPSSTEAVRHFIEHADGIGVLVMVNGVVGNNNTRKLDPTEFRGFALSDPRAPLVFVNGADAKAAQMFTLAHELAHVWLGQSGVSDAGLVPSTSNDVEQWCNAVAAELLVPLAALRAAHRRSAPIREEKLSVVRSYSSSKTPT